LRKSQCNPLNLGPHTLYASTLPQGYQGNKYLAPNEHDPSDDDCPPTKKTDSYKVEEKGNIKASEVDPGIYPRLLEAFKAEKQHRLKLEKSLQLQQKQTQILLEELANQKKVFT